ncbi:hypothetical protein [Rahnella perminowiae]|uniref:hypothetical protein n=1 Tax=Rahnella perminowiae TaxID=2816244 RepID=UPI00215B84E5|nr:hypothetical protein [Rahnella perminowiae]MCR9003113.1 hypothetical protein [Rahnella perminowiae]
MAFRLQAGATASACRQAVMPADGILRMLRRFAGQLFIYAGQALAEQPAEEGQDVMAVSLNQQKVLNICKGYAPKK